MKLLVRNLDRLTTEEQLLKIFQQYGTVQSCNVVVDVVSGSSKGFGFIEMPKSGEAKAAIKKLNNTLIGSNKIRVKKADDKTA